MADISCLVLTEQLQRHVRGRRLISAVFTTFTFDPGFLEQEILPALFDEAVSHVSSVRLLQMEDLLRSMPGGISVYYDADNLTIGDAGSGRLDVRRIPVRYRRGVFHPKTVFLLVEDIPDEDTGQSSRSLVVAAMSANLTRSGWWSNAEVAHIEEIPAGGETRMRDSIRRFLADIKKSVGNRSSHADLDAVLQFLRGTVQKPYRSTGGVLQSHFYDGSIGFVDFLADTAGSSLEGCSLEIISPYFDDAESSAPLLALVERFRPREVRVYLPRSDSGEALCRKDLFESVSRIANLQWGQLPPAMLSMGRGEAVAHRFVHAKVYRFFSRRPAREICFVGSVNLTRAAHERRNAEAGFLVEVEVKRQPDFWLVAEESIVRSFAPVNEDSEGAGFGTVPLDIRYRWDERIGEAYWDSDDVAGEMSLSSRGVALGALPALKARQWVRLGRELAERLEESLRESSVVDVCRENLDPFPILVQEEGMSHKPSLLHTLSAADILKYWALLSPAQRAAFLEYRGQEIAERALGGDLVVPFSRYVDDSTIFDRFAGIFHAFGCLERAVDEALAADQEKMAVYRIFGRKYDSLGSLLDKLSAECVSGEPTVENYVTLLCAKQLIDELARNYPEFVGTHRDDVRRLKGQLEVLPAVRQRLIQMAGPDLEAFLDWFDPRFTQRSASLAIGVVT